MYVTLSSKNSPNFVFCACPSKNVVKRDAGGKYISGANLAHIQPENLPNLQKMFFWPEATGVKGFLE